MIEVRRAGLQTSLQDLGRKGARHWGVVLGGAVDSWALRLANALVGNDENLLGLEWVNPGPELRFAEDTWVALTGGQIKGLPAGKPLRIAAGQVLDLRVLETGARGYLAVAGGLVGEHVLGGAGTDLRGGFGGRGGRALQKGDVLAANKPQRILRRTDWRAAAELLVPPGDPLVVRFVPTETYLSWSEAAKLALTGQAWTVSPHSDRMGMRLGGEPIALPAVPDVVSEGVTVGTIQVPPHGEPIVLLADGQTIGGYPMVGVVAQVDLGKVAQARAGTKLRLAPWNLAAARAAMAKRERGWVQFQTGLRMGKVFE